MQFPYLSAHSMSNISKNFLDLTFFNSFSSQIVVDYCSSLELSMYSCIPACRNQSKFCCALEVSGTHIIFVRSMETHICKTIVWSTLVTIIGVVGSIGYSMTK